MGFLSKAFRENIMSPIGRPGRATGTRPIFKDPEPMLPNTPIQPLPLVPQVRSPLQNVFDKIQNQLQPMAPPMVPPPIIPIKPPSIGGVGGTDFEDKRSLESRLIPNISNILEKDPNAPSRQILGKDAQGNIIEGDIREPIKRKPFIQELRPPITPPLEDFGFGPGIRPTEIRGPDGQFIGSAGVTPPDFTLGLGRVPIPATLPEDVLTNIENKGPNTFDPPVPITEPIIEPAPTTPAAVVSDVGAVPTPTMPMGAIDPVLTQQATSETLTDPLIRSLYFGTQDSPGFYQQLQQAGANLIGSDVPLQQTAGLTPLELLARQQAVAGIGGFEPFLQQNRDLVNQAIEQSRRAEQLQDPYYTQAEQIYQDTMGAYDPSMTQQFYNPFEDAVVQQTIEDVMKAGDKQDIAERAREISAGAFGGSRARLGAEERRQDLGEGLAKALSGIRQTGFSEAQRTGLGEFARQQAAKRTGAEGLMGIGVGRGSAASALGSQLAGYGGELTGLGATQESLRAGQRGELAGFGGTGRGIAETGLSRIYQQQQGQQQRPLGVLGQIGSMLPGYQASQTQIDSGYGMPTDPTAAGLGAAFSAYGALAPRQGSS